MLNFWRITAPWDAEDTRARLRTGNAPNGEPVVLTAVVLGAHSRRTEAQVVAVVTSIDRRGPVVPVRTDVVQGRAIVVAGIGKASGTVSI